MSLRPVRLLFTGDFSLSIPAGQEVTKVSVHDVDDGVALFATTAHTHRWGRRATVELLEGADDPAPRLLHESTDWAERELTPFEPIVVTPDHRLRLTCEFHNESDDDVGFGLSATDEMCFLWAHYVAAAD